jgi:hypothetical protein
MGAGRKKEKRCHTVMPAGNSRQRRQQPALGHMSSVERPTRQGKSRRRQRAAAETRHRMRGKARKGEEGLPPVAGVRRRRGTKVGKEEARHGTE